jgi:hypothetical protein
MSLKGGLSPSEFYDIIDDAKKGKKKALDILSKYVEKGVISAEFYNELVTKYRINKMKKDKENLQKIKRTLCGIIAFVVLFSSLGYALSNLTQKNGKGIAVCYLLLWLWAFHKLLKNTEDKRLKDDKIAQLKQEIKRLENELETKKHN